MLIVVLLLIGAIVGIAIAAGVRRSWRPERRMERPYPPERGAYGSYGPGYGHPHRYGPGYGEPGYGGYDRPHRSGMNPGVAGAIGAVGGGLVGYELGKMEGEQEQFHHDEALMRQREDYGPYGGPEQGDWGVDQGTSFIDGPDWGWNDDDGW